MNIGNLSPLQQWLERINSYIIQENLLKARFASLLLPVFEAWELANVLKKICFKSSREPSESFSQLTSKAHILAINIIFAGFKGFEDPLSNYQYHQACGLAYKASKRVRLQDVNSPSGRSKNTGENAHRRSASMPIYPSNRAKTLRRAPHIAEQSNQQAGCGRFFTARRSNERPGLPREWLEGKESKNPIDEKESHRTSLEPMKMEGSFRAPESMASQSRATIRSASDFSSGEKK